LISSLEAFRLLRFARNDIRGYLAMTIRGYLAMTIRGRLAANKKRNGSWLSSSLPAHFLAFGFIDYLDAGYLSILIQV